MVYKMENYSMNTRMKFEPNKKSSLDQGLFIDKRLGGKLTLFWGRCQNEAYSILLSKKQNKNNKHTRKMVCQEQQHWELYSFKIHMYLFILFTCNKLVLSEQALAWLTWNAAKTQTQKKDEGRKIPLQQIIIVYFTTKRFYIPNKLLITGNLHIKLIKNNKTNKSICLT